MKKFKEYGIRKLNSVLKDGDMVVITNTPTIADDDGYFEADGYVEFWLENEYKNIDLIQKAYIHHFTEDEKYIDTYKVRLTQKDIEEFEMRFKIYGWINAEEESICLGEGIEYEEGNEESIENAIEQLMKNIEMLSGNDN